MPNGAGGAGGSSGTAHRRQAVRPGHTNIICPPHSDTPAVATGFRSATHASFNQVVRTQDVLCVPGRQAFVNPFDPKVRVQRRKGHRGGIHFARADSIGRVQDLALQIADIHHVEIQQAQRAHARRRQIISRRAAEAAQSGYQHAGMETSLLAGFPETGNQEIAHVPRPLIVRKTHSITLPGILSDGRAGRNQMWLAI